MLCCVFAIGTTESIMTDFDEDPLDLLDDDGDGVVEMCLFFDENNKKKQGKIPRHNNGCCVVFLLLEPRRL